MSPPGPPAPHERRAANGQWLQGLGAVLAFVASVVSVVVSTNLSKQQGTLDAQQKFIENRLNASTARSERIDRIAAQLGSDQPITRLAGLFSLKELSDDEADVRDDTVSMMAQYLKLATERRPKGFTIVEYTNAASILARTSAAIYNQKTRKGLRYDLANTELLDVNLIGLAAVNAYMYGVHMGKSDLEGAHLVCVDLTRADLRETGLEGATFERVYVDGAHFDGATEVGTAHLRGLYWDDRQPTGLDAARAGGRAQWRAACGGG